MEQLQLAYQEYKKAKHLLTVTFPIIQDPKLLLCIIQNIHDSMHLALEIQRQHQQQQKPIFLTTFQELKEINVAHKYSPVEFSRKDKFIICSPDYLMKEVSSTKVQRYLKQNKQLLSDVLALFNRNK